ncbi:hypothetical protein HUA76_28530 [Myxococcus sp. CA056]|uniref:hypothetical protein n=1 Tax=Myxococcus sp. CA056 TaxID=2741740 RepID=UPI00157B93ED|nr:hypothetical protein [Myxococcus sp. CA056]NTX14744.1 hypothetical protein [Myxococcus sp. CA056]
MRVERIIVGTLLVGSLVIQGLHAQNQREALALLRDELDRVSVSVEKLQRVSSARGSEPLARLTLAPVRQASPTAAVAPAHELDEPLPPPPPAAVPFDANAARAHVERTFEHESSDSGWASEAQREIRENLSSHLPATASVRDLDCRATLCRLEVDFPVETDFQEAMGRPGAMARLWKGPSMARIDRDSTRGSVTVVGYLVRPGHPMPVEAPTGSLSTLE